MSAFVEQVTERDPPRSRNTLEEDEEDVLAAELEEFRLGGCDPVVQLEEELGEIDTLIVAVGSELGLFVDACFPNKRNIGKVCGQVVEVEVGCIKGEGNDGCTVIVGCADVIPIPESEIVAWGEAIVGKLGSSLPKSVVVFDTIVSSYFVSDHFDRCEPPLVRGLSVNKDSLVICKQIGILPLESGNVVTGLSSAILSECVLSGVKTAVGLISLREPRMERDTVLALIDPFQKFVGLQNQYLQENLDNVATIRKKCSKIEEHRSNDRSSIYI
uniref:Proteasome assembly chaperone 1 n=1 Tax=Mucochytrium quahogii TaxID=96639 RepID=A0A7S2WA40_9STRA|mmetsp:Transcript_6221/g.9822  ORF Transcript_6221/g.9822 Transcript_6221/m.9822 type:complete len:272 (-) Transcript_6221:40-855(-)|eukprot:CAMPEP_0203746510 /NCGR_PEP_ID=MMETSP0098-20131031/1938_1 /ASSEMBLY_ACC=CAM_ASM_000208 /TAXON_ID=96639 /ORGANISM=" , Strain NY0313808BC1" /LENGTH=271 /DNA_ID=CAMNT_0050634641 /DNA_START=222 /DNA_END=1037 /DNA_ORIENTATION=+